MFLVCGVAFTNLTLILQEIQKSLTITHSLVSSPEEAVCVTQTTAAVILVRQKKQLVVRKIKPDSSGGQILVGQHTTVFSGQ